MNVPLRLLRFAMFVVPVLAASVATAQNTTSGGGMSGGAFSVAFPTGNTQFANLSRYDCENNAEIDFSYALADTGTQTVEYLLSLTADCDSPNAFTGATACASSTSCPSMNLAESSSRPTPSDGMTTDFVGTTPMYPLTSGGIWDFYTKQSASMSSSNTYNGNNTTNCGPAGGIPNTLVYICVLVNPVTSTGAAATAIGSLSVALNSAPLDTPGTPTVAALDSGLRVTWGAVTNATWYNVYVQLASQGDGGTATDAGDSDAGTADGGSDDAGTTTPQYVATKQVNSTTVDITGLTNGTSYTVFVQALDDSGTNPPTSSNASALSAGGSGIPVPSFSFFQVYKGAGGKENGGGCSNVGVPSVLALLLALFLLRRRRQRRDLIRVGAIALALALACWSGVARAEDTPPSDTDTAAPGTPIVRKPSPEWFRFEAMTGPFYPNPDKGLSSKPFATVFPAKNQLLWRIQLHVNFFSLLGHMSAGVGVGIWQTNGHSLLASGAPANDTEAFTLYPITALLGYRADFIYTKWKVPIVPYGKVGWGFVPWTDTKDGKITSGVTNGQKWTSEGWANGLEWAVGIEFPLDFLDQQRAANMDEDFGINSVGIFGEFGWQYWKGMNGGLPLDGYSGSGGLYIAF